VAPLRRATLSIALGCLLALGCHADRRRADAAAPPAQRETAPDFTLQDLAGSSVHLAALRGHPVVIDFWATWCAPCREQIPVLKRFQARHGDEVVVLGVAVDADGRQVVAPFAAKLGISYRVLLGSEALAERYGAFGFPSLYVVGPDGEIVLTHVGVISDEELERAVAPWVQDRRRASLP
jgi:thiol-disulfide isomerase/thioredoxin